MLEALKPTEVQLQPSEGGGLGGAPRAHHIHGAEQRRERERVSPRREWKRVGP